MALSHAILALLTDNPYSGYDLAKDFDQSVNFFWQASHQQIYRELAKLETQGLITAEIVTQDGRPDKKLFHITPAGQAFLTEWVAGEQEIMPIKEDLLVKLWAGRLVPDSNLITEIEKHREFHVQKLAMFKGIEQEFFGCLRPQDHCGYLVLRRGIRYETDYIAWCDEALELLRNRADVDRV
jgi:DNA-binding PadR family transcriptional regulator